MTADSADLSALTVGTLTLTPTFDPAVTEYEAATTNATNKVTATAADGNATVQIMVGDAELENGTPASWADGDNAVKITVTNGATKKVYTVTVTKS